MLFKRRPRSTGILATHLLFWLLFSTAFLFVSYLFGVVIRLFSVQFVDKVSMFFYRKKEGRFDEPFPYQQRIETYFKDNGMTSVTDLMKKLNAEYSHQDRSFFHYCKFVELSR